MPKLIVIPTPIGNLGDVSERVLKTLNTVDLIFAEDTRESGKLFNLIGIKKKMMSYHQFNEHRNLENFLRIISDNNSVGLISDAGTPGISDPGFLIVRACIDENIEVECLPGPTALIPALVVSGLPCDRFSFEGFLPARKGRKTRLEKLGTEERTMVFYESPHRIGKTLVEFISIFGAERRVSVSRELSKKFEETIRGDLGEVAEKFLNRAIKGELTIVLEGKK